MSATEFATLLRIFQPPIEKFYFFNLISQQFLDGEPYQSHSTDTARIHCLGSLKSTFRLLLAHLLPPSADPGSTWTRSPSKAHSKNWKLCEKCCPVRGNKIKKML